MIFLLDDGSRVPAHRVIITHHSEYFARLLEGHYAEASQGEVTVHDISKEAFLCVLHHLYSCTPDSCKETKVLLEDDADVAVETSARAGQFLLPRLQDAVSDIIVIHHLSPSRAVELYAHGRLHGCGKLCDMCVLYLLCCYDVGEAGYRDLARCDYAVDVYKEIREVIMKAL